MIVLHAAESTLDHRVLKVCRPIHSSDLACKVLPNSEVLRSPGYALCHADQTGSDARLRDGLFSGMNVSGEMYFDASGEIETPFDRSVDYRNVFKCHHFAQPPRTHLNVFKNSMAWRSTAVNDYLNAFRMALRFKRQNVSRGDKLVCAGLPWYFGTIIAPYFGTSLNRKIKLEPS
jgi:hypothetical protein